MSPNWRSASTRTTGLLAAPGEDDGQVGGDHRLAGAALGREHGDDPAELAGVGRRAPAPGRAERGDACSPTRRTASTSCAVSTGAASTSLMPARSAWRNSSVVSSAAMRTAPTSGWSAMSRSASARPVGRGARRAEHDDDRVAGEALPERVERGDRRRRARRAASPGGCGRLVGVDDDDGSRRPRRPRRRGAARRGARPGSPKSNSKPELLTWSFVAVRGRTRTVVRACRRRSAVGAVRASAGRRPRPGSTVEAGRAAGSGVGRVVGGQQGQVDTGPSADRGDALGGVGRHGEGEEAAVRTAVGAVPSCRLSAARPGAAPGVWSTNSTWTLLVQVPGARGSRAPR